MTEDTVIENKPSEHAMAALLRAGAVAHALHAELVKTPEQEWTASQRDRLKAVVNTVRERARDFVRLDTAEQGS